MRRFSRFCCIDWSGAKGTVQRGIAIALAQGAAPPVLVAAPDGRPDGWSRAAVRAWLCDSAARGDDMLVGFDFSAGFGLATRAIRQMRDDQK